MKKYILKTSLRLVNRIDLQIYDNKCVKCNNLLKIHDDCIHFIEYCIEQYRNTDVEKWTVWRCEVDSNTEISRKMSGRQKVIVGQRRVKLTVSLDHIQIA